MEHIFQSYPDDARRIGEEYLSSLTDLNCNSKPLINMLTMLAEENINYAQIIVRVVEYHISQVPPEFKLPILYLIDSIIKNVKSSYVQLFGQCIVNIFLNAFESVQHSPSQVLEKVRERMYLLRQTWNEVFPPSKMYALDVKVKRLDNNWPITAKPSQPTKIHVNPAIHVNPDFLKTGMVPMPVNSTLPSDMEEILQAKTRELLELKKRKLELELEQTKMHLKEQERQINQATDAIAAAPTVMPAPVALAPAAVSPMYPSDMRHVRSMAPVAGSMLPGVVQPSFASKPKVHPVNPAMLSSVRPRDPRLARQIQPHKSSQMAAPMQTNDPRLENHKASTSSTHKSGRSRSKSPMRNTGSNRGKSSSSNNHHSSSNSSRKRSESKSSTASTSSSGSDGRHKGGSSSSSSLSPVKRLSGSREKQSGREHTERYTHNGGSPSASKRKSSSPASSPTKPKRNAINKTTSLSLPRPVNSKSGSSSNARSLSRSPIYRDVDMRSVGHKKSPEPTSALAVESMKTTTTTSTISTDAVAAAPAPSLTIAASAPINAVNSNDLEKPHLSTASLQTTLISTTTTTVVAPTIASVKQSSPAPSSQPGNLSDTLQLPTQGAGEKRSADQLPLDVDDDDDEDEKLLQPQQKRSKSAKLDALFGSEDVDLRRVLPGKLSSVLSDVIVLEDDSMDNWDENRLFPKSLSPVKKPTLDELRAKLAKTVRHNNKGSKTDESKEHPVTQRLKLLTELKSNDDSQEAHDEKMRTILSQAQEMFENHGMNQEQYKDLVTKVVAINESSKLKETRRRESSAVDEEDLERNAARDAVLRKRIPKLKGNENNASRSPRSDGEPRYEEQQPPALIIADKLQPPKHPKVKRDGKRRKPSKWGEQVDPAAAQRAAWQLAQNNNNINNNNNKNTNRMPTGNVGPGGGFRGMPWQHPPLVVSQNAAPPPPQPPSMLAMPPVPPVTITKAINSLDNPMADVVRSITIDGGSKEIRFYNQVAIIFMDGDEPHEIGFQHGQRAIYIDHNEPLVLSFYDDYKPFQLDGQLHRIRFGHPSRELYIDDHWYEIYFGGPPVSLPIGNKLHVLKAEGPPPNVDIGRVRRDLVVGKINMIVDAHTIVPLFLDGRQQTFHLGAEQHSLQFVDSFLYALLDGQLQKLEYGGLPKSMKLNGGRSCFIRFGTLPKGVQAGKTHVQDMVYIKTEAPAEPPHPPPLPVPVIAPVPVSLEHSAMAKNAAAPEAPLPVAAAALGNLNIDELFQKLVSSGIIGGAASAVVTNSSSSSSGSIIKPGILSAEVTYSTSKDTPAAPVQHPVAPPAEPIKRIELHKPDTIKTRQSAVIATLYLGMQCSSCGVRFPPEQTIKYSQHLDWHFRQNRRERDSTRKATSIRWFYDLNDWRQYEEIEDIEERERNFLEAQGQQLGLDAADEVSQQRSLDSPMPSCAAATDDVNRCCDMCHEKFEQFYNEELEEWHLRSAIRVDEKIYHPLCYEDYKGSLNPPAPVASDTTNKDADMLNASDDNAMDTLIKLEDDSDDGIKPSSTMLNDDDDDVIVLPNEEPSVTEIVDDDDDEYVPISVTLAEMESQSQKAKESSSMPTIEGEEHVQEKEKDKNKDNENDKEKEHQQKAENANESDVEIQEPHIPFTDLDTYVEKEPVPLLNVKIKEEPKDDEEDEDDGFEDVGTVVQLLPLPEDDISINSSETQTQTIDSSASPATLERPASAASVSNEEELELEPTANAASTEADFNGENPQETHNLSAAGLTPALPLASIVNKIKINITKNTISNSHNSASTTSTTATAAMESQVSAISVIGGSGNADLQQQHHQHQNSIQTISTIPVLCGGNTFVPKIATSNSTNAPPANISSISVIGSSYGSGSSNNNNAASRLPTTATSMGTQSISTASSGAISTPAARKSMSPPPAAAVEAEPEPFIELKPALRNATFKKTKKIQNGVETSGLCSIM